MGDSGSNSMFLGLDSDDGSYGSVGSQVDTSNAFNTGSVFDVAKTPDTATTNAVQSMAPVTTQNTISGSSWDGFWQNVLGGAVKTATQVAAAKNGVVTTSTTLPVVAPRPAVSPLMLFLGVAVVALIVTHKG